MKTQKTLRRSKQAGFIQGAVLFGLLLISLIVGAFALANRGPSDATPEQNSVYANTIVKLASDINDASIRYGMNYNLSTMTLDDVAATGLYDPAKGLASRATTQAQAMTSNTAGDFALSSAMTLAGATTTQSVVLSGVTSGVCTAINRVIWTDAINSTPPTMAATNARREGCALVGTVPTYYKILKSS